MLTGSTTVITDNEYEGYAGWFSNTGFILFHIFNTGVRPDCSSGIAGRHAAAGKDREANTD
jgi:hypothetical protein